MSEHQSKLLPGQIQFHQWCEPPIEAGDYTVEVEQQVEELGEVDIPRHEFDFSVAGPRFSLDPGEVSTTYPDKGQIGAFANTLPHVVFSRRTLPWERSITKVREPGDRRPWMALLVFAASDFEPQELPPVVPRPVGQLINPAATDGWVGPKLRLQDYESPDDVCTTLDVPWELFQATAPSWDDLGYLAHVREVNTDDKETSSFLADGWFSVVLANRFPEPERKGTEPPLAVENRAYLVSLEGLEDYLPGSRKRAAGKPVRLAVLSSWSFHCREAFTFKSFVDKLDVARIGVPWNGGPPGGAAKAKKLVRAAYDRGYTALNHSTRLGEKAVSWYRGPLVPLYLTREASYEFRPAADAALRYDPLAGMMDVTYAGAFQLGRLLALQDRHFATTLSAYRTRVRRQMNDVLNKKRLQSVLGTSEGGGESDLMRSFLKSRDEAAASPARGWDQPEPAIAAASAEGGTDGALRVTADFELTVPASVCRWLGRLMLLYRVPFAYLVPDERMLPPGGMRFFYLDPGWLKCLLEGACSVGRASSRDELVDRELRDNFLDYAIAEAREVRTRTPPGAGAAEERPLGEVSISWPQLTGFLLRSPIVEGWLGLEMKAWERSPDKLRLLKPLRLDRLGPDVMLCIFDGKVDKIELRQPPEGMHFGAAKDATGNGYTRHHLRRLKKSGDVAAPGSQIPRSKTPVPLRGGGADRVVDVATLADKLKAKLREDTFTSAELGVEMVESPGRAWFDVDNPVPPPGGST